MYKAAIGKPPSTKSVHHVATNTPPCPTRAAFHMGGTGERYLTVSLPDVPLVRSYVHTHTSATQPQSLTLQPSS